MPCALVFLGPLAELLDCGHCLSGCFLDRLLDVKVKVEKVVNRCFPIGSILPAVLWSTVPRRQTAALGLGAGAITALQNSLKKRMLVLAQLVPTHFVLVITCSSSCIGIWITSCDTR